MTRRLALSLGRKAALVVVASLLCACARSERASTEDASPRAAPSQPSRAGEVVAPRAGMAWVPPGTLVAGTPLDRVPRIADEEAPGVRIEMGGFYIDVLPWPNEPNAIPTSNVSREEAEQLCASKGKRLCTELEWERACKGPRSTTYEYGDVYRREACGTGVALEQAALRPTGEHALCKSGFGVSDLHGGVWEWTSSPWGRGLSGAEQGVLRGGNSLAGELVGRCANAIARSPSMRSPTMGFRCCAGTKNPGEVKLERRGTPGLALRPASQAAAWLAPLGAALAGAPVDPKSLVLRQWTPIVNEELFVVTACTSSPRSCALVVARSPDVVLATASSGRSPMEVLLGHEPRRVRARALDVRGVYERDVTYSYGRVDLGEPRRP